LEVLRCIFACVAVLIALAECTETQGNKLTLSVLYPVERIAFSNDWRRSTRRTVRRNAHAFVVLRLDGDRCAKIESSATNITYYSAYPTTLQSQSSDGARAGIYYEALVPRNSVSCQLSPYVFVEWTPSHEGIVEFRAAGDVVDVEVVFNGEFTTPRRPFFVGSTNSYILAGHCDTYCAREAELGHKYAKMLTAHLIQPIQNWVIFPPIREGYLDLDHGSEKAFSFRNLVMNYSRSGLVGFPRARYYRDRVAYLEALEATVQREGLVGRAWVYVADEPNDLDALRRELLLYRRHAPSVLTMVTTVYDRSLAPLIDIFAPVINRLGRSGQPGADAYRGHRLWVYASCMGSCGPNRAGNPSVARNPGPDTGLPDFLIDRPAERLFSFFRELDVLGAEAGFYYEATEGYRLWRDGVNIFEDPWNFGGNGDGLLLYPGRPGELGLDEHQPIPTMRLKLIRHAIESYW